MNPLNPHNAGPQNIGMGLAIVDCQACPVIFYKRFNERK
jgi:hypothetical protein